MAQTSSSSALDSFFNQSKGLGVNVPVYDQYPIPMTLGNVEYVVESLGVLIRAAVATGMLLMFMPADMADKWSDLEVPNWVWMAATTWAIIMITIHIAWIYVTWKHKQETSDQLTLTRNDAKVVYNTHARFGLRTVAFIRFNTATIAMIRRAFDFADLLISASFFIYIFVRYPHYLMFPHPNFTQFPFDHEREGLLFYRVLINGLFYSFLLAFARITLFYVALPFLYAIRISYNNRILSFVTQPDEVTVETDDNTMIGQKDRTFNVYRQFPVPVTLGWFEYVFILFSNMCRIILILSIFALFFDPNISQDWDMLKIPPWLWIVLLIWNIMIFGKNFAWFTFMYRESMSTTSGIQGSYRKQELDSVAQYSARAQYSFRSAALINMPTGIIALTHRAFVLLDFVLTLWSYVHFFPRYPIVPLFGHLSEEQILDLESRQRYHFYHAFIISFWGILIYTTIHLVIGYIVIPMVLAVTVQFNTATEWWRVDQKEVIIVQNPSVVNSMRRRGRGNGNPENGNVA